MGAPSLYRPGTRVRELAPPHRLGTIVVVRGRGAYAIVWVRFDGRGIVACRPSGLSLI